METRTNVSTITALRSIRNLLRGPSTTSPNSSISKRMDSSQVSYRTLVLNIKRQISLFLFSIPVISCGTLMTPIHGRKSNFRYTFGTEVQFDCDPEFQLIGERKRLCQSNGQWNTPSSRSEDRRTETEWYNWNPSKSTRCIGKHSIFLSFHCLAL